MQYTPVVNGNAAWQLYSGLGYWSDIKYNFEEWTYVKLIVSNNKMDVFINDMKKPILRVTELKLGNISGALGFGTFLGSAYYANLTYHEIKNPELLSKIETSNQNNTDVIIDLKVSEAFFEKSLKGITNLEALQISIDRTLKVDGQGILNLSYVSKVNDSTNTVLAKLSIDSEKEQLIKMDFGYSNKVIVFVNGKPVYSGNNNFRSRDYRYLGSIVYLIPYTWA